MKRLYNDNPFTDEVALKKKHKDLQSKKYEKQVRDILELTHGYVFKDIPDDLPEYDLETLDGITIEVKSDYTILRSNNLFVEIWDNFTLGAIGWFRYSKADILAVVGVKEDEDIPHKITYFDLKGLQNHVLETYFQGDWKNTNSCTDEYGDRIIYPEKDRPYLKYMLLNLNDIKGFIIDEFHYPWS